MSLPTYNGQSLEVLTVRPDEKYDLDLILEDRTIVKEALDLSEERLQTRYRALVGLNFTATTLSAAETAYIRKQFETIQDRLVAFPIWPHKCMLMEAATAGATDLVVDQMDGLLFSIVDYVMIWSSWDRWEVVRIAAPSIFSTDLPLAEATTLDWEAGVDAAPVYVLPVFFGTMKRPEGKAITDEISTWGLECMEIFAVAARTEVEVVGDPEINYSECLDEITVDWGSPLDAVLEVYTGDSSSGPWEFYTSYHAPIGGRSSITLGNYFQGTRYLQVRAYTPGTWTGPGAGTLIGNIATFLPDAPMVEPPEILIDNISASSMAFPEHFTGLSGNGDTAGVMTIGSQNLHYPSGTGRPTSDAAFVASLLFSDATVEIRDRVELRRNINLVGDEFPQAVTLTPVTVGSTALFTVDGTDPVEGTPVGTYAGLHDSGDSAFAEQDIHSRVLIARCFKDGCKSPPVYIAIDQTLNVKPVLQPRAAVGVTLSTHCTREHSERNTPGCELEVLQGDCPYPYVSGHMGTVAAQMAAGQAQADWDLGVYGTDSAKLYETTKSDTLVLDQGGYYGEDDSECPEQFGGGKQQGSATFYAMRECICSSVTFVNLDDAPSYCFGAFEDYVGAGGFDEDRSGVGVQGVCGLTGTAQNLGNGFFTWMGRAWSPSFNGTVPWPDPSWFRTTVVNNYPT
jgi:hypothetical protein